MDISGLFAGTFQALRQRLGLFVLLVLFPSVVMLAVVIVAGVIGASSAATGNRTASSTGLVIAFILLAVGAVVAWLAQLKSNAMMVQAAYEIAQGQRPDFKGLLARTKGFLPRFMPLIFLFLGVMIVVYLVFGLVMFGLFSRAANSSEPGGFIAGIFGVMALMFLLGLPLAVFFYIKLFYVVPACTIEQRGGIESLKRSWYLTKGSFWRTLGYAILPALAVSAVLWVVSAISQAFTGPLLARMPSDPTQAQVVVSLLALLPVFAI
ncbi:MAG: hypothetical protein L0H22_07440, partial [Brevibacterium aurantiacum]|nr:hypothetical protein [Brevibacterium aurantiacum]